MELCRFTPWVWYGLAPEDRVAQRRKARCVCTQEGQHAALVCSGHPMHAQKQHVVLGTLGAPPPLGAARKGSAAWACLLNNARAPLLAVVANAAA